MPLKAEFRPRFKKELRILPSDDQAEINEAINRFSLHQAPDQQNIQMNFASETVAVGMPVARHPPHGSQRA
jgi:hypothetical protein